MKKFFLLPLAAILSLFLYSIPVLGANFCARPTGSGLENGKDWDNAIALKSAVQSSAYRGHTIYISGESYGAITLSSSNIESN